MSRLKTRCSTCNRRVSFASQHRGEVHRCPYCNHFVECNGVPDPEPEEDVSTTAETNDDKPGRQNLRRKPAWLVGGLTGFSCAAVGLVFGMIMGAGVVQRPTFENVATGRILKSYSVPGLESFTSAPFTVKEDGVVRIEWDAQSAYFDFILVEHGSNDVIQAKCAMWKETPVLLVFLEEGRYRLEVSTDAPATVTVLVD